MPKACGKLPTTQVVVNTEPSASGQSTLGLGTTKCLGRALGYLRQMRSE